MVRLRGDWVLEPRAAACREPAAGDTASFLCASKTLLSMKSDRLNKPGRHRRSSKFTARGWVTEVPRSCGVWAAIWLKG